MKLKVVFSGFLFFLFLFMPFIFVNGQENKDIRINEVLINTLDTNQKTIHEGWVEIFNCGDSAIDIAGCYFTNDPNNGSKYSISNQGSSSILNGHSYMVFYSSNNSISNASRLNFSLNDTSILPNGKGYIALFDTNGTTLINGITYDIAALSKGGSYGIDENVDTNSTSWINFTISTPGAKNITEAKEKESGNGMLVALIVLGAVFILFFISRWSKKSKSKKNGSTPDDTIGVDNNATYVVVSQPASVEEVVNDEIVAAIAMALHLYNNDSNEHEIEQTGFRLDKNHIKNAPWANKMFILRKLPIIK